MKKFELHIKENTPDHARIIAEEYWEIENGKFLNRVKDIAQKYSLSPSEVKSIVKGNSFCKVIQGYCIDCAVEMSAEVSSHTSFIGTRVFRYERCIDCKKEYQQKLAEEKRAREEAEERNRQYRYKEAIRSKKWQQLNTSEFRVLLIVLQSQTKKEIYEKAFNGDHRDKSVWNIVNKLERLGLIAIIRSDNGNILHFDFDESLPKYFKAEIAGEQIEASKEISEPLTHLNFLLLKNNRKNASKQPDYSGGFMLEEDVVLKAGVKYTYGGWINLNGSVSIRMQPEANLRNFAKDEQTHVYDEPKAIKVFAKNLWEDFNKS